VVFCIVAPETFDSSYHLHARGFAPLVGVPEDPFTGSMQGGLAAYAINQGMLPNDKKWIGVEQGHFMDRPGFVKLEISKTDPIHVRLHSEAVHLFSSELILP
jgi:PhzF family phenazine biosynthesis protein